MPALKVTALIGEEPGPHELWTLRRMAAIGCELSAVQAAQAAPAPPSLSRRIGAAVGKRVAAKERELLGELFDEDDLRAWWESSGVVPVKVPELNHAAAQAALSAISPDLLVRVSGGMLKPHILSRAKIAALGIHHGQAPLIRGTWCIPWGIVEGRRDWIGAAVHIIDDELDTGPILWRGSPQLAPGDTHVDLFFRAHLEAADALVRILSSYASGDFPRPWPSAAGEFSAYRASAGLREWVKLLCLDQGRRARVLLERGIEC